MQPYLLHMAAYSQHLPASLYQNKTTQRGKDKTANKAEREQQKVQAALHRFSFTGCFPAFRPRHFLEEGSRFSARKNWPGSTEGNDPS